MEEKINKSAGRAVDLIEIFVSAGKPLTLSEVMHLSGFPKTSCFELIATLVKKGILETVEGHVPSYKLGSKLFEISFIAASKNDLYGAAHPVLKKLSREVGGTAYLAVRRENEILYIDKVESDVPIRSTLAVGSRNNMHTTGLGKAILAAYSDEMVRDIVGGGALSQKTPYSIKTYVSLIQDLDKTRRRGYAIDDREDLEFMRCVAAPIMSAEKKVLGAISVSMPDSLMPYKRAEEIGQKVKASAMEISKRMGYAASDLYDINIKFL